MHCNNDLVKTNVYQVNCIKLWYSPKNNNVVKKYPVLQKFNSLVLSARKSTNTIIPANLNWLKLLGLLNKEGFIFMHFYVINVLLFTPRFLATLLIGINL